MLSTLLFGKEKRASDYHRQHYSRKLRQQQQQHPLSPRPVRTTVNITKYARKSSKEENKVGFLARSESSSSSGEISLLDVDDETLEKLVGGANHLSLVRKGSRGKMIKVNSYERFDALVPCVRSRSISSADSSEESDIFSRMKLERRSSLTKLSPLVAKSPILTKRSNNPIGEKRGSDLIDRQNSKRAIIAKTSFTKDPDEFITSPKVIAFKNSLLFVDVADGEDGSSGQNPTPKRQLTKERLGAMIKTCKANINSN